MLEDDDFPPPPPEDILMNFETRQHKERFPGPPVKTKPKTIKPPILQKPNFSYGRKIDLPSSQGNKPLFCQSNERPSGNPHQHHQYEQELDQIYGNSPLQQIDHTYPIHSTPAVLNEVNACPPTLPDRQIFQQLRYDDQSDSDESWGDEFDNSDEEEINNGPDHYNSQEEEELYDNPEADEILSNLPPKVVRSNKPTEISPTPNRPQTLAKPNCPNKPNVPMKKEFPNRKPITADKRTPIMLRNNFGHNFPQFGSQPFGTPKNDSNNNHNNKIALKPVPPPPGDRNKINASRSFSPPADVYEVTDQDNHGEESYEVPANHESPDHYNSQEEEELYDNPEADEILSNLPPKVVRSNKPTEIRPAPNRPQTLAKPNPSNKPNVPMEKEFPNRKPITADKRTPIMLRNNFGHNFPQFGSQPFGTPKNNSNNNHNNKVALKPVPPPPAVRNKINASRSFSPPADVYEVTDQDNHGEESYEVPANHKSMYIVPQEDGDLPNVTKCNAQMSRPISPTKFLYKIDTLKRSKSTQNQFNHEPEGETYEVFDSAALPHVQITYRSRNNSNASQKSNTSFSSDSSTSSSSRENSFSGNSRARSRNSFPTPMENRPLPTPTEEFEPYEVVEASERSPIPSSLERSPMPLPSSLEEKGKQFDHVRIETDSIVSNDFSEQSTRCYPLPHNNKQGNPNPDDDDLYEEMGSARSNNNSYRHKINDIKPMIPGGTDQKRPVPVLGKKLFNQKNRSKMMDSLVTAISTSLNNKPNSQHNLNNQQFNKSSTLVHPNSYPTPATPHQSHDYPPPGSKPSTATNYRPPPPIPNTEDNSLSNCSWYRGKVNRQQSEKILRDKNLEGGFIIRDTDKGSGYSISIFHYNTVTHLRVPLKNGRFCLGTSTKEFTLVQELVAHFQTHKIQLTSIGGDVLLRV